MTFSESLDEVVAENTNGLLGKHESWGRVRLGDVATITNGAAFSSAQFNSDEGFPLIRIRDILGTETKTRYAGDFDDRYVVQPGDLLVGMDGDFNSALWKGPVGLLNQRVCRIEVDETRYSKKFLSYALPGYLKGINARTSSLTVKHLSSRTVGDIPLPAPALETQIAIAGRLDELFSDLDAGVAALERAEANLARYRAAALKAAVEGKLTEQWRQENPDVEPASEALKRVQAVADSPTGGRSQTAARGDRLPATWIQTSVGSVTDSMKNGIYKPAKYYDDCGVACLRMYNIDQGRIVWRDIKRMLLTDDERKSYGLHPGDLLVNRVNSRELVGKAAVIPDGIEECVFESKNVRLRVKRSVAEPRYVGYQFSVAARSHFASHAQQVVGMASISQRQIAGLALRLPPLQEQQEIVRTVEHLLAVQEGVVGLCDQAVKRAGALHRAILAAAFSGLLVDDEAD